MSRTLLILALAVFVAAPAGAQGLKLAFNQGRVSVDATSVPVKTILNEWAKLGDTKVIGAEKISGAPLTLKLEDVPEAQALDIILRSVAGYMAAPRSAVAGGASIYDRILVLATSTAPATTTARPNTPTGPGPAAGTQRFVPQRPVRQVEQADEDEEEDPNPPNPPVFSFPQPGQPGFQPGLNGPPGAFNGIPQGAGNPVITVNPSNGAPQSITVNPAPGQSTPYGGSATPFGGTGAAAPGMIQQPAPVPGQPGQPVPMVRPPG